MSKYGIEVQNKICVVCEKQLLTTDKRISCHAQCREEFYRRYYKERYRKKYGYKLTQSRIDRARARWFLMDHVCAVTGCGYSKITKAVKASKDGKMEAVYFCPKHLYEYRLGFLEPFTWKEKTL